MLFSVAFVFGFRMSMSSINLNADVVPSSIDSAQPKRFSIIHESTTPTGALIILNDTTHLEHSSLLTSWLDALLTQRRDLSVFSITLPAGELPLTQKGAHTMSGVVLWTVRQQFGWQATDDSSADAAAAVASPFHYTRVALLGAGVGGSVAVYTAATCKEGFAAAIALPGGLEEGSIPGYEMIDRRLEQCAQMNDAVDAKWGVRWLCENGDGVSQWALAYCRKLTPPSSSWSLNLSLIVRSVSFRNRGHQSCVMRARFPKAQSAPSLEWEVPFTSLTLTGSLQRSPLPSTSCCRALRVTSRNYRDVEYKYQNQIESSRSPLFKFNKTTIHTNSGVGITDGKQLRCGTSLRGPTR